MPTKSVIALTAFTLTLPWSAYASTVFQATLTGPLEYPLVVVTVENGHGSVIQDDSERDSSFDAPTSDLIDGIATGFYLHGTLSRYAATSTVQPASAKQVSSPTPVTKSAGTPAEPALRTMPPLPQLVMPLSVTDLFGEDVHFYLDDAELEAAAAEAGDIDDPLAVPEPSSIALLLAGIALLLTGLASIRFYPLPKR